MTVPFGCLVSTGRWIDPYNGNVYSTAEEVTITLTPHEYRPSDALDVAQMPVLPTRLNVVGVQFVGTVEGA